MTEEETPELALYWRTHRPTQNGLGREWSAAISRLLLERKKKENICLWMWKVDAAGRGRFIRLDRFAVIIRWSSRFVTIVCC